MRHLGAMEGTFQRAAVGLWAFSLFSVCSGVELRSSGAVTSVFIYQAISLALALVTLGPRILIAMPSHYI